MIAYHGNADLKAQFVRLLSWHQEQDKIVQGSYQDDETAGQQYHVNGWEFESFGRGCAVGCSIESLRIITKRRNLAHDNHALYEELIGVPRILARLEDGIFEGLPIEQARAWPVRFAEAISEGTDLSRIWPQFAVWLLADPADGVIKFAGADRQRAAIQNVADLYMRQLEGADVPISEWRAAADAAAAAYAAAAYAAAAYAAAYAADAAAAAAAAADAAAYAAAAYADAAYAAYAAYADADADADAAAAAAKQNARIRQAEKLIELLKAAPAPAPAVRGAG